MRLLDLQPFPGGELWAFIDKFYSLHAVVVIPPGTLTPAKKFCMTHAMQAVNGGKILEMVSLDEATITGKMPPPVAPDVPAEGGGVIG